MESLQQNFNTAFSNQYVRAALYISVFVLASHTMNSGNKHVNTLLSSHIGRFIVYFFAAYIGSKNVLASGVLALVGLVIVYAYFGKKESFNGGGNIKEVVMYYAPWCGWSKKALPEWEKLEASNDTGVGIRKVNCEDASGKAECEKHNIKGFPTIKVHKTDGTSDKYTGARTADAIKTHVKAAAGSKASAASSSSSNADASDLGETKKKHKFVVFYAPWCGHCKKMLPDWKNLEKQHANHPTVEVISVDCVANPDLAKKYGIKGFPTIVLFTDGERSDYTGGRTEDAFNDFVHKLA